MNLTEVGNFSSNERKRSAIVASLDGLRRALARLAQSWWSVDRVRAARSEGRLLRVRPPAVMVLDGREIEVIRRSVAHGVDGAFVIYECQTSAGPAEIRVAIVGRLASPRVVWVEDGREQPRSEDEFEIWAP